MQRLQPAMAAASKAAVGHIAVIHARMVASAERPLYAVLPTFIARRLGDVMQGPLSEAPTDTLDP